MKTSLMLDSMSFVLEEQYSAFLKVFIMHFFMKLLLSVFQADVPHNHTVLFCFVFTLQTSDCRESERRKQFQW